MKALALQFARFGAVGVVGTAAHFALLTALVELAGAGAVAASSVGALAGALVNYVLNRWLTFVSERPHREALPRFLTVAGVGFGLNALLMALATTAGVHYLPAQAGVTGMVLIWNFIANRWWTFREPGA